MPQANVVIPPSLVPPDDTKFLNGAGEWSTPVSGGGTIQGTLNIVQKGDGAGNAVDAQIENVTASNIVYFLVGTSGDKRVFSISRLNTDDVQLSGESGADVLMLAGSGGSFTVQTDGGLGDDVIMRAGPGGSPAVRISGDRIALNAGLLQTDTGDIAGQLTLVAGTIRKDFVKTIGSGLKAVVVVTPTTAPTGVLSVAADATGFDVTSSINTDVNVVNYVVFIVPIPA